MAEGLATLGDEVLGLAAAHIIWEEKGLITKGEIHFLPRALEYSTAEGMQTFDQCLFKYYKEGIITAETAISYSDHKTDLTMRIKAEGWVGKGHEIQLDI